MRDEERSIHQLAYQLWESRGRPEGTANQDWIEAERQFWAEKAAAATAAIKSTDVPSIRLAPSPSVPRKKLDESLASKSVTASSTEIAHKPAQHGMPSRSIP